MEFVLLPLLLLLGLATALDGGDDDNRDDTGDENDVLTGAGSDRVYGGTGDDDLTLEDRAVGLGGVGDDTIHARDEAVGYGLEGDDSLTGEDNATIKGGAGDDWLSAEDEAAADGGSGDDWLTLAGDANGSGGDGDDTLTASGEAVIRGGAGNDVLIYQDTAGVDAPEEGDDIYVLDHASPGGANLGFAYQSRDAGDRIAIHLGTDDLSNFSFRTVSGSNDGYDDSRGDITEIFITETLADGETKDSYLSIRGVYGYGLRNLILYGEEIGQEVDWQEYFGDNDFIEASGSETVHGGVGNDHIDLDDSAVGYGDAGNDLIHTWGTSTAYGGAGNDALIASVGNTSLAGGAGNDIFAVDWRDADVAGTTVTDFVAGQDKLAVLVGTRDLDTLRLRITEPEGAEDTVVELYSIVDPDEVPPIARFTLQGVSDFDPNDLMLSGADLSDPLEWTADPAWTETITGSADADTITLNDSQVGLGEGGNDTIIANDEALAHGGAGADSLSGNDVSTVRGGAGNDSLTASFAAEAYGEAGDDVMLSFGNAQFGNQPSLYGGDGHDTLSGDGDLYGGAGNDLIEPDADGSLFNGVDSYSGAVYGGDGDDTIRGDDPHGGLWGGLTFYGGAGNDLIASDEGGGIDAGAGNDIVLTRLHDAVESADILMTDGEVHSNYARTTLGAGSDVLALDLLSVSNPSPDWPFDGSHVIADFNPDHDELALILPSADVGAFTASLVPHAPTGFMQLRLENETASMTLLLEGVTSAFPIGEINIYADEAAVIARTPYASL